MHRQNGMVGSRVTRERSGCRRVIKVLAGGLGNDAGPRKGDNVNGFIVGGGGKLERRFTELFRWNMNMKLLRLSKCFGSVFNLNETIVERGK
jgi:hypothetical protein